MSWTRVATDGFHKVRHDGVYTMPNGPWTFTPSYWQYAVTDQGFEAPVASPTSAHLALDSYIGTLTGVPLQ
jgi:hypothetical protein